MLQWDVKANTKALLSHLHRFGLQQMTRSLFKIAFLGAAFLNRRLEPPRRLHATSELPNSSRAPLFRCQWFTTHNGEEELQLRPYLRDIVR
jgi:hypothetical protein